jgi:hypothetical protein
MNKQEIIDILGFNTSWATRKVRISYGNGGYTFIAGEVSVWNDNLTVNATDLGEPMIGCTDATIIPLSNIKQIEKTSERIEIQC